MNVRELKRQEVMSRVKRKEIGLADAAALMDVSYRQAKRIWRRYRQSGAKGLVHASVGRSSSRSKPAEFRRKVLARIQEKYGGPVGVRFGPTLAAEHLAAEDKLEVHPETLRRWMLAAKLWSRARKRAPHRKRRERRAHFGELVQFDGSPHDWFEGRGEKCFLMNMVDDATSRSGGIFSEQESIWAAVEVLRDWVTRYGIPQALYTDGKNVYVQEPTVKQQLRGELPVTQFGRMCQKLGIRIIAANSPQAKGRVERNHATHQDRLIKKMRLKRISSIAAGNQFLPPYLAEHNRRFTTAPASAKDYHTPVPKGLDLDSIFRLEEERILGNEWVISYHSRRWQITRQSRHAPARSKVTVCEWADGRLRIYYREREMAWEEFSPVAPVPPTRLGVRRLKKKSPVSKTHPWKALEYRTMNPRGKERSRKTE